MVEMVIYGVSFDLVGKQPIVLLKTADGNRFLPIWIGHPEAAAILMKLQNASTPRPMTHDLVSDMLEQLEARVAMAGIRTLAVVIDEGEQLAGYFRQLGYRGSDELRYFERDLLPPTAPTGVLLELGGQLIGPGLWDALKGMEEAKEIIERRVILPLAEPELAGRHGVVQAPVGVTHGASRRWRRSGRAASLPRMG